MGVTVTVRRKTNRDFYRNTSRNIYTKVGVLTGGNKPASNKQIVIASSHELGLLEPNVQKRSMIKGFFRVGREYILDNIRRMVEYHNLNGGNLKHLSEILAQKIVAGIQERMSAGIPPALAPSTLEQRERRFGSTGHIPLILFGRLRQSFGYEIKFRKG